MSRETQLADAMLVIAGMSLSIARDALRETAREDGCPPANPLNAPCDCWYCAEMRDRAEKEAYQFVVLGSCDSCSDETMLTGHEDGLLCWHCVEERSS